LILIEGKADAAAVLYGAFALSTITRIRLENKRKPD